MLYHERELRQRLLFARVACLSLGVALVLWGVAPALIDRAVTGEPAGLRVLAIGGTSILLGAVCVMLFVLMRSGGCWPMRVAFGLSLSLVTIALGGWVLAGGHSVSLFLLVLAGSTTVATWLSLSYRGATARALGEAQPPRQ